jgi:hypothetical protein
MSSLGQLVAGAPTRLIIRLALFTAFFPTYKIMRKFIELVQLYQHHYPDQCQKFKVEAEKIDLEFFAKRSD